MMNIFYCSGLGKLNKFCWKLMESLHKKYLKEEEEKMMDKWQIA